MANYTLIESRDLFESREAAHCCDLAVQLKMAGNDVTLFLVQNGVLSARSGAASETVGRVVAEGVAVLADAFSLRERGLVPKQLVTGVQPAEIDVIVDHLSEGNKVIWQ